MTRKKLKTPVPTLRQLHEACMQKTIMLMEQLDAAQLTIKAKDDLCQEYRAKLYSQETRLKDARAEIEALTATINNHREFIHSMQQKVAKVEGYLTRVQEEQAAKEPKRDPRNLVEVPQWLADRVMAPPPQRSNFDWQDMMQSNKEPKWFEVP